MSAKTRSYCFTIHDTKGYELLIADLKTDVEEMRVKYFVFGLEICPTTDKEHLQGYIYYANARSFNSIKKEYPMAHIEAAKGTPKQAADYCKKENAYIEGGELPQQGTRSDLDEVKDILKTTGKMSDVVEKATSYQSVRMAEAILKYKETPRDFKPQVLWFHGSTGTGKSKEAYEILGADCYTCLSTGKWFEGYDAHENVLIDDMRRDFMKFHELLRLLDRYAMRVECKGGSRQFKAKKIIITSAFHPRDLFETREDIGQLLRRIDTIKLFGSELNDNQLDNESE